MWRDIGKTATSLQRVQPGILSTILYPKFEIFLNINRILYKLSNLIVKFDFY